MKEKKTVLRFLSLWLAAACLCLPALAAPEEDAGAEELPAAEAPAEAPEEALAETISPSQVDLSYSGALDGPTGLPASAVTAERQAGEPIPLGDGSYGFVPETNRYTVPVGSRTFTASVPMGIVLGSGESVSFQIPEGLTGTLYRNGDIVEDAGLEDIRETGSYILKVQGAGLYDEASFAFTIMGPLSGTLTEYILPRGFTLDEVTLNGEAVSMEFRDAASFLEDGEYKVSYSCGEIGKNYSLTFTLDREPPELALPEVKDGQAHSAVTLEDLEEGAWIEGDRDGTPFQVRSSMTVLKEPGQYTLTVYDQAGNSTQYDFIIHVYLNISAAAAIALALAGVLGVFLYCRWVRKHIRVG